ncbi:MULTISPECIES: nucleotidyltransferase domain-containing protein [unclassified Variovorax]|uniref:nucleotidyltransferase domain-containing protein n=1 Tax=unclassified Variovorax TaxID=663243 RepID=UPI002577025E|nr:MULTISPECIES: nucleotidyltransferase domain-containing protein [unclassified Variovorax]MDM0089934.1 nucleotidyltransferase domain-containing protein [Variovorax sp. J22G40]MDM0148400.1 nucleotidyltransferase domain-containing protein [Variovorax sp. J2P1-31]
MSNETSLMDLLFPAARQRVLAVLLLQPRSAFHLRELARLTDSHAGTLGREVDKLARTGLLLRSEQGNQVRYNANTGHPLFEDLAALFRKTHGVVPAVREALAPLDAQIRLALVFGSVARGTPSPGSDVDLLVLGDVNFMTLAQAVFPLHAALGREVNTVLYAPEEFAQRVRTGDAFARDILAKPQLFVKGGADELAGLAGDRAVAGPPA